MLRSIFAIGLLITLFLFAGAGSSDADTSTFEQNGQKQTIGWDQMVGQIVTVDGLAWGANEKGLGPYLVLPNGRVYVHDVDLVNHDLNGRLLRVSGFLRRSRAPSAVSPQGLPAQGYSTPFNYYYIDAFSAERIDKVTYDQLLPSRNTWLHVGMNETAALALIKKHRLPVAYLSLIAPPGGHTWHTYVTGPGESLLLDAKEGTIVGLTRYLHSDQGKRHTKSFSVRAFPIPEPPLQQTGGKGKR